MRANGFTRRARAAVGGVAVAVGLLGGGHAAAADPLPLPPPTPVPAREAAPPQAPPLRPVVIPNTPAAQAGLPASPARVYVLDGVDPLEWAATRKLARKIEYSGYPNTKYGGWFEAPYFEWQYRREQAKDPSAQSVWIGYSFGSYPTKWVANRLTRDGLPPAMVGYVGGDYLHDTPRSRPAGVPVTNVRGDGYLLTGKNLFFNGTDLTGATNVNLRGTRHFDLPTHPSTGAALYRGMNAAAPGAAAYGSYLTR